MVSTDKFNLLYSYIFKNNNVIDDKVIMDNTFSYNDKSILYICQNGTSGYANAAKGYIYDYIGKKIPVKTQYFNCSDELNENDRLHEYLNSYTSIDIDYNTIIVHSTPDIWTVVIKNTPNINLEGKLVIGRTVWEFEKLLPAWVDAINTSIVDIVSVPTEWNKQCFIKSGVKKPIIVEPHVYIDYPHKNCGISNLFNKSLLICKSEPSIVMTKINSTEFYKFYCIGQLINRKGILETLESFCRSFVSTDKVILLLKTFKLNYSESEKVKCITEITRITDKYNHAPILFIKENLNYDEIKSLHDIGDCYIHLTKTEGFCLGAFDAFNNNKKVIITGYGGHIEYLGKDYDGLVDYELTSLAINESVFFQFKLDDTYKWAIPNKEHAGKLLRSKLDVKKKIELINFGEGFHSLEKSDERSFKWFKWMSDRNEIYINENIDFLTLDIINVVQSNTFKVINDTGIVSVINLNEGNQIIDISVKNTNKIIIESGFFIPSKITNCSNDNRKLSCKLFDIKVTYKNTNIDIPIDKINYTNVNIKNINSNGKSLTEYIGEYGEMSVRLKDSNASGKINLGLQTSFYSHRSGWDYVVHNMSDFNNPNGINFDGFIENAFSWRKNQYILDEIIPYKEPWIGFLHNPPNMPLWFSDNNSYPQTLIHDAYFKESLNSCKGLYVLSNYYKRFLKRYLPQIPINVLYHPTEIPNLKFNFDKFYKNKNKSVVNIGWWLRKLNSIFLLDSGHYQKIRLMPNNKCKDTILRLIDIERDLYSFTLSKNQIDSVKFIDHLDNNDYDVLLSQNIVFLDLYDTSANNAVIECIARGTPLLINRHSATIEYLGEEYPFYFDSLKEANEKLNNVNLIRDTHQYLMTFDKRKQITIEYFKQQFKESDIYQSL